MWRKKTAILAIALAVLGISLVWLFPAHSYATTGINQEISFEGKIVTAAGLNIPDGTYNMEFKIYTGCTNNTGTGCSTAWTEDYIVGTNPVTFTSGTFQVNLGSTTAFGGSVPWNTYPLYLSMEIGNTSSCTLAGNFHANCGGDNVMSPYILLTSTPYALNANAVGGLTASQLGQLATSQTFTGTNIFQPTTNIASVQIYQTSVGSPTADILDVATANTTNMAIQVTGPSANTAAVNISSFGANNITLATNNSAAGTIVKSATNSTTAFAVQDSSNKVYIQADTSGGNLYVGNTGLGTTVQIGNSATASVTQSINVGTNSSSGSISNVNIGQSTSGTANTNIGSSNAGTVAITGNTTITNRTTTPAFPSTPVLDNFNVGSLGSSWATPAFGTQDLSSMVTIGSTQAGETVAGTAGAAWKASVYGPDTEVYADVPTLPTAGNPVYLDYRDDSASYTGFANGYYLRVQPNITTWSLYKIVNGGAGALVGNFSTGTALTAGDSFGISAVGSTHTAWRKTAGTWAQVGSPISDSTFTNSGYVGFQVADTTTRIDNFGAGSVSNTLTISNSTSSSNIAVFNSNTSAVATISNSGQVLLQNTTNSTAAFSVQTAAGGNVLNVDTTNQNINTNGGNLSINGLANPATPTAVTTSIGSTNSYLYRVAAYNTATTRTTVAIQANPFPLTSATAPASLNGTNYNTVTWQTVPNATGYIVYRSIDGGTTWFANTVPATTVSLVDNGGYTWATSGTPNANFNSVAGLQLQSGSQLFLDGAAQSAYLAYLPNYNYLTVTNANVGGAVYLQSDSLQFRDTTGFNTDFSINNSGQTTFQNRTNSTAAFNIKNTTGQNVISVNTAGNTDVSTTNLANNPSVETAPASTDWVLKGTATIAQDNSVADFGSNSIKITGAATNDGAFDKLNTTLTASTSYNLLFYAKSNNTTNATVQAGYSINASAESVVCTNTITVTISGWTRYSCTFTTPASGITSSNAIFIKTTDATARTINVDGSYVQLTSSAANDYTEGQISLQASVSSSLVVQNATNSNNAFSVQNSAGGIVFNIDTTDSNNLINNPANPGFEVNTTGWSSRHSGGLATVTIARYTSQQAFGVASLLINSAAQAGDGARYTLATGNWAAGSYTVSFSLLNTGTAFTAVPTVFFGNGSDNACAAVTPNTVPSTSGWTRYSSLCTFSGTTTSIVIAENDTTPAVAHTFYLDSVQIDSGSIATAYGLGSLQFSGQITSPVQLQNQSNSTTALQLKNSVGNTIFAVDTLNNAIVLGNTTNTNTVGLKAGTTSASYTWTLPTADTAGCLQSNGTAGGDILSISPCGDTHVDDLTATSSTWNKQTNALMLIVELIGGGGGGGGGGSVATLTASTGGGAGGGGAYVTKTFLNADVPAGNQTVTVGAATGNAGGGSNAAGTAGSVGNNSSFLTLLTAYGGGGGKGGTNSATLAGGGGGGGSSGAGVTAASATGGVGGLPGLTAAATGAAAGAPGTQNPGNGGAGGGNGAAAGAGGLSNLGGAGGGGSNAGGTAGNLGGSSAYGGAGGGAGGSCAATCAATAGGAGGKTPSGTPGGGGAGGAVATCATTGAGGAGSTPSGFYGGSGGGGGASIATSAGTGCAGGAGGAPGGGGGGGGATVFNVTGTGGAGGAGARGEVRITTLRGTGADLAEIYCTNDVSIVSGDVVSIDGTLRAGVKKSQQAYDSSAVGIISTAPGLVTGSLEDQCAKPVLVALSGRVPLKVSLENGPIKTGDYLTASSTPGVAMRATKAGQIIGQALTSYTDSSQPDAIVAFVEHGTYNGASLSQVLPTPTDPTQSIEQQALAYFMSQPAAATTPQTNLSEILADRVSASMEVITPSVVADKVATNTITPSTTGNVTFLLGDKNSVIVKNKDGLNSFTIDGTTGNAEFGLSLSVLGDMLSQGKLTVNGDSQFNGNATFAKMAQFIGDTTFAGNIDAQGRVTFNSDTGGLAIIKQGDKQVNVSFTKPYTDNPIVSATLSAEQVLPNGTSVDINAEAQALFDAGYSYLISNVSTKGFTILLNKTAAQDIEFSWTSISVKNAGTTTSGVGSTGSTSTNTSASTSVPATGTTTPTTTTSTTNQTTTSGP